MVAAILITLGVAIASPAQDLTTVVTFSENTGANPQFFVSLVQGLDGNLYGTTTMYGGDGYTACGGCGGVFKVTPTGTLFVLYSFCVQTGCPDGRLPEAGMTLGSDGNFYGTTAYGGTYSSCFLGCGTVFRITSKGTLTTLHSFDGTDGAYPVGALVQAADGNFYGTTAAGGHNFPNEQHGTVFKITAAGVLTTLHNFNGTDGEMPYAGVIQGADGNLYGTTVGTGFCNSNCGTVFRITEAGALTVLHRFNGADGELPYGGLVQAADGAFSGTTDFGGTSGLGTVFRITRGGTLTTLHSFDGTDGSQPYVGLVHGTDGNLYGTTTEGGGSSSYGTAFRISPAGALSTLYSFSNQADGYLPNGLVQATNGNFFGTTYTGGANVCGIQGCGTVFALSLALRPFVQTVPQIGGTAKSVIVLGNKLTGATSVTFNGIPASFTVESATAIRTNVPVGATTGPVQVVTPSGTLTSNVNFQVLP
jgi:uncharacterized repeat protein (TIGR03803 family)